MKKICIIKLGALGDVVRTLPILLGIKEKFPDSEISWVTKNESFEIVSSSPYIKKVYVLSDEISEIFDILYNFDVEPDAVELAKKIKSDKKFGFSSEDNFPSAFNTGAEYYLNTIFDDEFKKTNKKTYQEMIYMAAELPYKKQHHEIFLKKEHEEYSRNFINENEIKTGKTIEIEEIKKYFFELGIRVHASNPKNSIMEFASLVKKCDFMVCSDSFALHISLALKKPTIGLFFCTPPNEIESYGLLKKIISPMLYDFFPEKMDKYDENLVKSISAEDVFKTLLEMENKVQ